VPVEAQLYTEDGRKYGPPMEFTVKISEITSTVMLVIAGGVLLLVLAGVRMYSQRKRAATRSDDADTVGEAGEADPAQPVAESDDPVQPSDPATDTEPQSTDPSGPGEKVKH
ncbi:hypothetical protein ACE14D_05930, partial [Streptomyces sp. Act-28]